jgi:hypothetical protein
MARALKLFYSYAHEDEELRDKLMKSLSPLREKGRIEEWHDRKILAGESWGDEIDAALDRADIILLLLSNDFLDSPYINDVEVERALARHRDGTAVVVPILLRAVLFEETKFSHLQALPTDAVAIRSWNNEDEALVDVVKGLVEVIKARAKAPEPPPPRIAAPVARALHAVRDFDDLSVDIAMDEVTFSVDETEYRGVPDFSEKTLNRLADLRQGDADKYGTVLFDAVFGSDDHLVEGYERARARIRQRARLRLRLHIDRDAETLHTLCWEALRDCKPPPRRLATQHGTPLSRYVDGADLEPVRGTRLRLLIVVSDPAGLGPPEWPALEDYDAGAELAMVESTVSLLDDRVDHHVHPDRATPQLVREHLLREPFDVLHLVAPGVGGNGHPRRLLLEDDAGARPDPVEGDVIGAIVAGLDTLRLVVVSAGYTSAGSSSEAHLDIAAQLLDFGIPAVLALDGRAADTAKVFTKAFYETLLTSPSSSGLVDVAANHAREAVWFRRRDAWDWAAPVVFLGGAGHIYDADTTQVADVELQDVQPGVAVGVPAVLPTRPVVGAGTPAQRKLEAFHLLTVKYRLTAEELESLAWSLGYEFADPEADLQTRVREIVADLDRAGRHEELIQQTVLVAAQRAGRDAGDPAIRALESLRE